MTAPTRPADWGIAPHCCAPTNGGTTIGGGGNADELQDIADGWRDYVDEGEGPPPEAPAPVAAVAGQPGHYLPAGAVVPNTEIEFLAIGLIASPLGPWPVADWVATGDGTHMSWTGSVWVVHP